MQKRLLFVGVMAALSVLVWSGAAMAQVTCEAGASLEVEWGGSWYAATVVAGPNEAAQCQIHYDGYDSSWDEWVGADRMRARAELSTCPVGGQADVLWGGSWYASTIIAGPNESGQCQIHYNGWSDSFDEWVGADRMRAKTALCVPDNTIQVNWNDTWYDANVVSGNDQSCLIHYVGYDDSWNESVGPERMRARQ